MNLDKHNVTKFFKGNTTPDYVTLIKKAELRTGRQATAISFVVLAAVNFLSYFGDDDFNKMFLMVSINVGALIIALCVGVLSVKVCNNAIRSVHIPKTQNIESKTKITIISSIAGVAGMTIGRVLFSNISADSAFMVFLGVVSLIYGFCVFFACKSFYIIFLIKRFNIT